VRHLTERYEIESIAAVDLFPQTHHVETVVRLAAKK
jgi:tRNA/tmRNA/rRNA uracil-C5-methylase (TrmA/RlmC/RlmD family)